MDYRKSQLFSSDKYLPLQLQWYLNLSQDELNISKEYLDIVATEMRKLPWQKFIPESSDLERMYRIFGGGNQSRETARQSVVAHVIVKIDWATIIERRLIDFSNANILSWMFFLAVRVPYELGKLAKEDVLKFFERIDNMPWALVGEKAYGAALDWIVLSSSQFPIAPNFGATEKSCESAIFVLLLKCAQIVGPGNISLPIKENDHLAVAKKRRLTAAIVRLFATCSPSNDTKEVQAALKLFLVRMTNHFVQGGLYCGVQFICSSA